MPKHKLISAPKPLDLDLRPGQSVELLKELHILTREGKLNQDSRRKLKQVSHLFQFIETLLLECYTCTSLCAAQACVLHKHVCCTSMCAAQAKGLIAALSSINFAEFKYVPARRMLETPVEADELGS